LLSSLQSQLELVRRGAGEDGEEDGGAHGHDGRGGEGRWACACASVCACVRACGAVRLSCAADWLAD
jgi:hypothetical protein